MPDIEHMYGSDLTRDSTGDIAIVNDTQMGVERVIRRLMTSQGQYLWDLSYGAGLPTFLGLPAYALRIIAAIRQQLDLESAVASTPVPAVNVRQYLDTTTATIQYVDAQTGESAVLNVPIVKN